MRSAVVAVVAALVALATTPPAGAGGNGDGGLDDHHDRPRLSVGLEVEAPGAPGEPGTRLGPHDGRAPRPVRYEAVPAHSPPPGLDNLCNPAPAGAPPAWGWWYTVTAIDTATGAVLSSEPVCVPLTDPTTGPPAPPVLPTPPTIGEIWDAANLPAPTVGVSPAEEGVVGLDTWLWSGGADEVAVAVTLAGYTVTGVAHRTQLWFDTGDGAPVAADAPGSAHAPATTHVYDVKGGYTIRVGAQWQADVTMTGPGLPAPLPVAIGSAVVTAAQDYPVVEVRSVLVP